MIQIETIKRYTYKGREYESLAEIKAEVQNTLGLEVLDQIQRKCPLAHHKDYFKLMELICSKKIREILTECLNVKYLTYDEDHEEVTGNILDLK